MKKLICPHCGTEDKFKHTFLGFPKIYCKKCNVRSLFPLTQGYVIVYWILTILGMIGVLLILTGYYIGFPIFGLLAGVGLYKNKKIRKD